MNIAHSGEVIDMAYKNKGFREVYKGQRFHYQGNPKMKRQTIQNQKREIEKTHHIVEASK